jgi:hypothetical protein
MRDFEPFCALGSTIAVPKLNPAQTTANAEANSKPAKVTSEKNSPGTPVATRAPYNGSTHSGDKRTNILTTTSRYRLGRGYLATSLFAIRQYN